MTDHANAALLLGSCLAAAFATPASAQTACPAGSPQLIIYHAGSLSAAFTAVEKLFTQQTGTCITDVAAGSLDAARQVTAGKQPADIYASADYVDIDALLKPAFYASYNIVFAEGGMVLAYKTTSKNAATIADPATPLNPPASIPNAAANWYAQLVTPGLLIGGSNPFLDPSGYRSDMIFQLAARLYDTPFLYDQLLQHYTLTRPTDALGVNYDYNITYEHSAFAAYQASPSTYRYVKLPDGVNLSNSARQFQYERVATIVPGLGVPISPDHVAIPATRVGWGLTILRNAPHPAAAIGFLKLLFSPAGVALQTATGPTPISPPIVSDSDYRRLPDELKPLVRRQ